MQELSNINVIKEILSTNGFTFSKSLGQNFLINPTVCPRMAEACGADENTGVIEIGAVELAKRAKKVVSLELDTRLIPVLAKTLEDFDNIEVLNADVLKTDLGELIAARFAGMRVVVCANLPYYITSPVIMYLLESRIPIDAVTVMVQTEAAARLCAPVGSRDAGAVTVAVNYYADAKKLFDVSAGSFMPAPKVDSSVIRLDIRPEPPVEITDEKFFFRVVKAAFGQRRKTASNSLSAGLGIPKDKINAAIAEAGFPASVRAESLKMEDLARLSECIAAKCI